MSDPCCALCKGPHGICLSKHACHQHKVAQKQDDANHRARRTVRDPTGDAAVASLMRANRAQPRRKP